MKKCSIVFILIFNATLVFCQKLQNEFSNQEISETVKNKATLDKYRDSIIFKCPNDIYLTSHYQFVNGKVGDFGILLPTLKLTDASYINWVDVRIERDWYFWMIGNNQFELNAKTGQYFYKIGGKVGNSICSKIK